MMYKIERGDEFERLPDEIRDRARVYVGRTYDGLESVLAALCSLNDCRWYGKVRYDPETARTTMNVIAEVVPGFDTPYEVRAFVARSD